MDQLPPELQINEEPLRVRPAGEPPPWDDWEQGRQIADIWQDLSEAARTADRGMRQLLTDIIEDVMDRLDEILVRGERSDEPIEPSERIWLKRIKALRSLLTGALAEQGVTPIDVAGLNPGVVEIAESVPRDDVPHLQVLEVVQRGWLWRGKVLRKARVVVAVSSDSDADAKDARATAPPREED